MPQLAAMNYEEASPAPALDRMTHDATLVRDAMS